MSKFTKQNQKSGYFFVCCTELRRGLMYKMITFVKQIIDKETALYLYDLDVAKSVAKGLVID